jgi:tRNA(Ile)-lysidine synthase
MDRPPRRFGGPGFDVVEQAIAAIERHNMLEGEEKVLVAVSGGPDSTCLLDVLWRIAGRMDLSLEVAHVDHGLSENSGAIASRVAQSAAQSGFEVHLVRAPDLTGPNLHARAREFRYGFFETVARRIGADRIATGHTLDDRAETTLARLLHGAPPETLAGIPPLEGPRMRPLIEVRRAATRGYCEDVGLEFDDDPANVDDRFERSLVRTRLMAEIEKQWGEGAVKAIARAAEHLREDADALDELSLRLYKELVETTEGGVRFESAALKGLPRALQRRLLDRAVGRIRDRSGGIEAALEGLEKSTSGKRYSVARGIEIALGPSDLQVLRPPAASVPQELGSRDEP